MIPSLGKRNAPTAAAGAFLDSEPAGTAGDTSLTNDARCHL
jgi:hypothetical protein